jgi:mannose-6-phosphate isomerase-like protein (cupin superfamily)
MMRTTSFLVIAPLLLIPLTVRVGAQGQRRAVGSATFAIIVSDPAGAPLGNVKVTLQGPKAGATRTERGRSVFEELPAGTYKLTFEREGFLTAEREITIRPGALIDVKITLTPAGAPKPATSAGPTPGSPRPAAKTDPVALDIAAFIEKNFVGRAASRNSSIACSSSGTATLMQLREGVAEHAHAEGDEYLYVIAGNGAARIAGVQQPLSPSVFVLIPRTAPHVLAVQGRSPLVLLSIKTGEPCDPRQR